MVQNSITVLEVAVLAFFARKVYRKSVPGLDNRSLQAGGIVSTVYGSTLSTLTALDDINEGYI